MADDAEQPDGGERDGKKGERRHQDGVEARRCQPGVDPVGDDVNTGNGLEMVPRPDRIAQQGHDGPRVSRGAQHQGDVMQSLGAAPDECFFWATDSGPELDLLWVRGRRRWGFEFKRTSSPTLTGWLRAAVDALDLQKAFVIHAGERTFPLHRKVTAVAGHRVLEDIP